ncbi:hypothetical protein CEXT_107311 [Caerostris extrusa]|uniref:Uncharacterized protein n=1 Tax=Caerostris extrusa TaxID=172846 RepID=A0AAV4VRE8_CAEEX|nr:hypothetical protein CEXT_107311 [Caerostris extrusa]
MSKRLTGRQTERLEVGYDFPFANSTPSPILLCIFQSTCSLDPNRVDFYSFGVFSPFLLSRTLTLSLGFGQ